MSSQPRVPLTRLVAIILVFPLLGPIVGALIFVVMFGTFGIITMGPLAIVGGLMYFFWWLPSLHAVYGPPFLLTGILYALAVRLFAPASLLVALTAGALAFAAYLAARYWAMGSLAETDKIVGPHAWTDPWSIAWLILIGVLPCWWLTRDRNSPRTRWY